MNKIKISNLRTLFELRKTKSFAQRVCQARIFIYEQKIGLCDSSGYLWPVFYDKSNKLLDGDIIVFEGNFIFQKSESDSKYDDLSYQLKLNSIVEKVPCQENWKNSNIPSPIPDLSKVTIKHENFTCYYSSQTKKRFRILQTRTQFYERVKKYFLNRHFYLMETPTLVPSGSLECYLNAFSTNYINHYGDEISLQLPTSPELALKKILSEIPSKIFQISKSFRNHGELSDWHEPEFFMLEWYRVGGTLKEIMNDTQNLILTCAHYLGSTFEFPQNWPRFRVDELFQKLMNLNLNELQNRDIFYNAAKPLSISIVETDTWDDIFCKLFMEKIEPYLKNEKACFVTHYPLQMAALAQRESVVINDKTVETNFALRSEVFINGIEICNAYQELVNANTLKNRIEQAQKNKPNLSLDDAFSNSMNFGLPFCAGNALGLDRLLAVLLGFTQITPFYPIPFRAQFIKSDIL